MVAVLLLHAVRQPRLHPQSSDRDQARAPRDPQGDRPLRRRAGAGRPHAGRWRVTQRYDYALQALTEVPYDRWREFDPEDTLRFYALRLHEAGMIRTSPNTILTEGTDWRFLNEIKRELKA